MVFTSKEEPIEARLQAKPTMMNASFIMGKQYS
jgi:hypothetical protein